MEFGGGGTEQEKRGGGNKRAKRNREGRKVGGVLHVLMAPQLPQSV